jgi:hypothetical protein
MMVRVEAQDRNLWDVPLTTAEVDLLAHMLQHESFEWVTRLWFVILKQAKLVGEL